jgi:hypothetical protein
MPPSAPQDWPHSDLLTNRIARQSHPIKTVKNSPDFSGVAL